MGPHWLHQLACLQHTQWLTRSLACRLLASCVPELWERLLSLLSLADWHALSQTCRACRVLSKGAGADAVLHKLVKVGSLSLQLASPPRVSRLTHCQCRPSCHACVEPVTSCVVTWTTWQRL